MPKVAKELSDLRVRKLQPRKVTNKVNPKTGKTNPNYGKLVTAYHPVGGVSGLLLRVTPSGSKSWILRATVGNLRRDIGLGGYPDTTLSQARERARKKKDQILDGLDPVIERRKAKAALKAEQETRKTFAEVWPEFFAKKSQELAATNQQHWKSSIENYALPVLGTKIVADIEMRHIKEVLKPIWTEKTMLAKKLRGRLEAVLSFATVNGYRQGDNPARWKDNLAEVLAKPSKVHKTTHFRALPIAEAPDFMKALSTREGTAARALEFAILTAARSGEVRGALWDEIDLKRRRWSIPAERMKMERDHIVPLSDAALAVLKKMQQDNDLIFPAPRGGQLSDMSLLAVLKRMGYQKKTTVHGFRSTFKDWATEETDVQDFISEMALAHSVGDEVQQAYKRSDLAAKRLKLMRQWSQFLGYTEKGATVVQIEARA